MSAPLRRVLSKHTCYFSVFRLIYQIQKMTSALPICIRCSKPVNDFAGINRCGKHLIYNFKGLSVRQLWTNSTNCPKYISVCDRYVPDCKLSHLNCSNHEHLFKRSTLSVTGTDVQRSLSSYYLHHVHRIQCHLNSSKTGANHSESQQMQKNHGRRFKSDVLCKNSNSSPSSSGKEGNRLKILSPNENIYTIPNLLTLGRMLSAPFLGYMVVNEYFVFALGLFAFAGVSDLLDGYIARNFKNQNSILGSALDPMADKILISVLTLTLTAVNLIPFPLTALIVGRDVGLIAAAFYLRYISLPPPKTLSRYFDVTLVSAKLEPFTISKWNTAFQLSLVALTLAAPVFQYVDHPLLQGLWYLTGATTFISGLQYLLFWKDSVKILQPQKK